MKVQQLKTDVGYQLDTIVNEVNRQSFGGSKTVILDAVNQIAEEMDLPRYEWSVNVSTGLSERVGMRG